VILWVVVSFRDGLPMPSQVSLKSLMQSSLSYQMEFKISEMESCVASEFFLDKFKSTSKLDQYMFIKNGVKEQLNQKDHLTIGQETHKRLFICFFIVLGLNQGLELGMQRLHHVPSPRTSFFYHVIFTVFY
jgi:hypothetical protein